MFTFLFTESKTWTEVSHEGKPPAPRDKLTAVAIGTNIFYFGGFGPKSEEMELDDVRIDNCLK